VAGRKKRLSNLDKPVLGKTIKLLPGYDPYKGSKGYKFNEELAQEKIDFFTDYMTHAKGRMQGQPYKLRPWEQAFIGNIFGWVDKDGFRRYKEAFLFVPRKNSKTTLAAGICNLMLFCDGEPGAEIYAAAADREQASILFSIAKHQVLNNAELAGAARVFQKAITIEDMGSSFKPISKDANTKHGYNSHAVIVDELHAQPNRELVDALVTSTGAREQPLIIYITTSDFERPSICNEKHEYASKVRDGIIEDPRFLPAIYEATIDDDWTNEKVWARANPNLGHSISIDYLRRECQKAKDSPAYENTFKRLHLNIRTEQDIRWIQLDKWDACPSLFGDLSKKGLEQRLRGRECFAGLDLSSTKDITCLSLVFPEEDGLIVLPYFWLPAEKVYERDRKDRTNYGLWIKEGLIEETTGNVLDYDRVQRKINELGEIFDIKQIASDPWGATQILTGLAGDGFDVVQFRQGYGSMSAPSKEFERLILSGKLHHEGNKVLRWMASNVTAETDAAGNIKPSKSKSNEKIDGIVATVMGVGLSTGFQDESTSIYAEEELMVL